MQTQAGIPINRGARARSYLRGVEFSGVYSAVSSAWAGVLDSWLLAVIGGMWLLTSGLLAALLLRATASPTRAAAKLTQDRSAVSPPLPNRQQDVPVVVPLLLVVRHGGTNVGLLTANWYPRSWE